MSKAVGLAIGRWGLGARGNPACADPEALVPSIQSLARSRDTLGCELVAEVLRSFGQVRLRVNGASMLPTVLPGDILTVCRHDTTEPLPGDIVLFGRDGRLVAHRIVEVRGPGSEVRGRKAGSRIWDLGFRRRNNPEMTNHQSPVTHAVSRTPYPVSRLEFVTCGDSMRQNDPPISSDDLLGRVVSVKRGSRTLIPHRSPASRVISWILSHSDFVTRVVLKGRVWRLGIRDWAMRPQDAGFVPCN